jgi:DNA-binding FadR family transcriptional regulator
VAGKHDQIAGSLIQDILAGHYRVSERLPSERDLAARFDANRGAVREAMKQLEQIGLADVQPGGARVKDQGEASLDVIGHMLAQGELPDNNLVDQILVVMDNLLSGAAEQCLESASDDEINEIRRRVQRLMEADLDVEAHILARFELMHSIMLTSQNLPVRLIARTLINQMAPNLSGLHPYANFDAEAYRGFSKQLDDAFAHRDKIALRAAFKEFSNLNRESMMRAFEAAREDLSLEAVSQ